jgi:hypothetical protein
VTNATLLKSSLCPLQGRSQPSRPPGSGHFFDWGTNALNSDLLLKLSDTVGIG